jgi:hypothetical protein
VWIIIIDNNYILFYNINMSYSGLELDGTACCPICGEEGNRRVSVGCNLSEEEREEFKSFEMVECPIHGDVDLSYKSTVFLGWQDGESMLKIFQQSTFGSSVEMVEVDRNNFRSLRSSSQ